MARDSFVTLRRLGEDSIKAVAFLPLLLALIIAYFRDLKRSLLGFLGKSEPPAPTTQA